MVQMFRKTLLNDLCNFLFFVSAVCCIIYNQDVLTRRGAPGLKAPKKLWWAKEITPDLHVAGGLTERQIKYALDGGFKSLISLYREQKVREYGDESLITDSETRALAKDFGFDYENVLEEGEEWASLDTIRKLTKVISRVEKPTLLFCDSVSAVTFTTLMYLLNVSRHDPDFTPVVNSDRFYKMSVVMGHDYTKESMKNIVAKICGEPVVEDPPKPNALPENWYDGYWLAHPVYKNWYTAGQLRKGHLHELEFWGFKSVVNMRQCKITNGDPSQETVTLINIKDGTPTYDDKFMPLRQSESHIKTLVLDQSKEPTYVSPTSAVNYESRNDAEYGDEIGYNEELERQHFEYSDIKYYHMPIDSHGTYSADVFRQYKDELLEIGKQGPVLVHCASGKRVAFIAVLAAALQYHKDLDWALKRINELGFQVSKTKNSDVYEMYSEWLDPNFHQKSEL